jgi:hypothetical protein
MTRYYPVLSECTLEDCGAYERFQLTNGTVWHRYAMNGEIVWILIFADEEGSDKKKL